ncbi:MAG: hypothetical protein ABEL51_15700 [Salinibacter sp.]
MTVAELRKQLERFDDDASVCIEHPLHVGNKIAVDARAIERVPVKIEDDGRFRRAFIQDEEEDDPFNTDRRTEVVIR